MHKGSTNGYGWMPLAFIVIVAFSPTSFAFHSTAKPRCSLGPSSLASAAAETDNNISPSNQSQKIHFDIAIKSTDINVGRLVFQLTPPSHPHHLPLHTSNLISLASSSRISIDPKATYKNCEFQFSPSSIEDGSMRYRWGHVCNGPSIEITNDAGVADSLMRCKHSCFGGAYYGLSYKEVLQLISEQSGDGGGEKEAVVLTVPTKLSPKFSIVRVSESPKEWGERLLLNSAVIGYLDGGCLDVLRAMARQRVGVPKIVNCGVV